MGTNCCAYAGVVNTQGCTRQGTSILRKVFDQDDVEEESVILVDVVDQLYCDNNPIKAGVAKHICQWDHPRCKKNCVPTTPACNDPDCTVDCCPTPAPLISPPPIVTTPIYTASCVSGTCPPSYR